jgi:hypothetical protein
MFKEYFIGNVLPVSRRNYDGDIDTVKSRKSQRNLPVDSALMERLRVIGHSHEWAFSSRVGSTCSLLNNYLNFRWLIICGPLH